MCHFNFEISITSSIKVFILGFFNIEHIDQDNIFIILVYSIFTTNGHVMMPWLQQSIWLIWVKWNDSVQRDIHI